VTIAATRGLAAQPVVAWSPPTAASRDDIDGRDASPGAGLPDTLAPDERASPARARGPDLAHAADLPASARGLGMRLAQVLVFAKNLATLRAFYHGVLGLAVVEERDEAVWLDAGGVHVLLHAIPRAYADEIEIRDPPEPRSTTPLKLIFQVDDVRATREHLRAHGAQTRELAELADGRVSCDCVDPEGNVFRIANR
jgi:catechol 2,3-dioxygenase-like lactoylglutathione lyase family enzyme